MASSETSSSTAMSSGPYGVGQAGDLESRGARVAPRPSTELSEQEVVLRVLLAEDDEFQRLTLRSLFAAANQQLRGVVRFDVSLVASAGEVLEVLRLDRSWQLVMLDIFMPGRDGDEIIGEVRAFVGDKVPVLMISGSAQLGAVQRCLRLGADMFVAKPLHLNVVKNLWQHVMIKDRALFENQDTAAIARLENAPPPPSTNAAFGPPFAPQPSGAGGGGSGSASCRPTPPPTPVVGLPITGRPVSGGTGGAAAAPSECGSFSQRQPGTVAPADVFRAADTDAEDIGACKQQ